MAGLDNLIGSHLSLISQQDVRYDGVLYSINAKESSIVLRDVKCFGSEDRIKEEYKKIPANPQILSFVTFPGHEIKDLSVFESSDTKDAPSAAASEESKPKTESKSTQPNSRQGESRTPKPQAQQTNNTRDYNNNNNNNNNRGAHNNNNNNNQAQNQNQAPRQNREQNQNREPRVFDKPKSSAGTGEHLAKLRLKKGIDGAADPESSEEIKKEFDFEAGLNTFNKTEVLATVASETAATTEAKYVKDDFFDTLTNDTQEKRATRGPHDERTLNQDTFGAIAVQQNYHHRNNGGYRGRGGGNNGGGRNGGGSNGYNGNGRGGRGGRGGSYRRNNNSNTSEVPAT